MQDKMIFARAISIIFFMGCIVSGVPVNAAVKTPTTFGINVNEQINYQALDNFIGGQNDKSAKFFLVDEGNLIASQKPIKLTRHIYQPKSLAAQGLTFHFQQSGMTVEKIPDYRLVDYASLSLSPIPAFIVINYPSVLKPNRLITTVVQNTPVVNTPVKTISLWETAGLAACALVGVLLLMRKSKKPVNSLQDTTFLVNFMLMTTNHLNILCNISKFKNNIDVCTYFYFAFYMPLQKMDALSLNNAIAAGRAKNLEKSDA